jgi:hypothetical protein
MIAEQPLVERQAPVTANGEHPADVLAEAKRFDVFLIDSGWNTAIAQAVQDNLELLKHYLERHNFYVLTKEQSLTLLKQNPLFIGADPILLVIDPDGYATGRKTGFGFRLNLGILKNPDAAISLVKWVLQVVSDHWTSQDIAATVRKASHKEGVQGTMEIIVETSSSLLVEGVMV